jgi:hypothetical protein
MALSQNIKNSKEFLKLLKSSAKYSIAEFHEFGNGYFGIDEIFGAKIEKIADECLNKIESIKLDN